MARKLRTSTKGDLSLIDQAHGLLWQASLYLQQAKAIRSATYVSRAMKSVEGARRHAVRSYGSRPIAR